MSKVYLDGAHTNPGFVCAAKHFPGNGIGFRDTAEEWGKYGLLYHTDIVLVQNIGSKAACIAEMLKYGYDPDKVLMVCDAPGDCAADQKSGVWYYPILVNAEKRSWDELIAYGYDKLKSGCYSQYGAQKKEEFLRNLGG